MQNHVLQVYTDFNFTEGCILSAAITRAREAVVVVGSQAAMRTAVEGTQGDVRLSSLHARLATAADRLNLPRSAPSPFLACDKPRLGSSHVG